MARLALALAIAGEGRQLVVDRQTSRAAFAALGQTVLLYRSVGEDMASFEATAVLGGIETTREGELRCLLRDRWPFASPQLRPRAKLRRSRQMMSLEPVEFDRLLAEGRKAPGDDAAGLLEADAFFEGPVRNTRPITVYRQVLAAYGYRCAVTGERFAPGATPHLQLRLAFIRPKQQGGVLHVRNLMPMVEAAHDAWERGVISATADHRIVAVVRDLSLALFDKVESLGLLHLPDDERYRPDPEALDYHFRSVFGG